LSAAAAAAAAASGGGVLKSCRGRGLAEVLGVGLVAASARGCLRYEGGRLPLHDQVVQQYGSSSGRTHTVSACCAHHPAHHESSHTAHTTHIDTLRGRWSCCDGCSTLEICTTTATSYSSSSSKTGPTMRQDSSEHELAAMGRSAASTAGS
jgi:hypothetical protein